MDEIFSGLTLILTWNVRYKKNYLGTRENWKIKYKCPLLGIVIDGTRGLIAMLRMRLEKIPIRNNHHRRSKITAVVVVSI